MGSRGRFGPLVGAIDEGTSSARFLVFAAETAEVLTYHQVEIEQLCPKEGWVEQDPMVILDAVNECIEKTIENLKQLDIDPADIVAVGITNQRESTVIWDRHTGRPLSNCIVWLDTRTAETVDEVLADVKNKNQDYLKPLCGLPVSTYFSALKARWLRDNVPEIAEKMDNQTCLFGTIDTWLIWNLTGGRNGGLHVTDVTNASRTMLMNIKTLQWDPTLCEFFTIPMKILPQIRSSSEIYGYIAQGPLQGIPISGVSYTAVGAQTTVVRLCTHERVVKFFHFIIFWISVLESWQCLGDQQSALVGQMCFQQGQAKNTYGTGCFLLYNTGTAIVQSSHGLLTTVGYRLGKDAPTIYALEGSVAIAGVAFAWLRDNLGIVQHVKDTEKMVQNVKDESDVCFVPAFSGLYAPYWRKDARSVICGLTEETSKETIVKAAMEAVCFQTRDILEAMNKDCGIPMTKLLVDGGMTANNSIMQLQADLTGIPVVRPLMMEATALGAAMAAGSAEGIGVWDIQSTHSVPSDLFYPAITEDERDIRYHRWKMAIKRSLNWQPEPEIEKDEDQVMHSTIPASLFILSTFGILVLSKILST